ncbi:AAA family ATPase [Roseibium sp.]|uniref:AAA family ATPase n=1 Tax=Roseibium sp. TaxID=1936156 RepID=UPI003B529643
MKVQSSRYIPPEFIREVTCHLMLNRAKAENPAIRSLTMLIVQGPAGSGKTTSIRHICNVISAPLYEVHGKELVSEWEGQATAPLEKQVLDAANDPSPFQPVVLVDDIEMSGFSVDANFTGTVNSKACSAWLMSYADNPHKLNIRPEKAPPRTLHLKRPPALILTVNNISALHSPMVREGRASICTLDPRGIDLQRVLAGMYPKLSVRQAGQLIKRHPGRSVALFSDIGAYITKKSALRFAQRAGLNFKSMDWAAMAASIETSSNGATYHQLADAAEVLAAQSRSSNFVAAPDDPAPQQHQPHNPMEHSQKNGAWFPRFLPGSQDIPASKP